MKKQRVLHFVAEVSVLAVSGTWESAPSTPRTLLSVGHQTQSGSLGLYNMSKNKTATD